MYQVRRLKARVQAHEQELAVKDMALEALQEEHEELKRACEQQRAELVRLQGYLDAWNKPWDGNVG